MNRLSTLDPAPARASRAALAAGMLAFGAAIGALLIAAVHDAGHRSAEAKPSARGDSRTLDPGCRRAYQLVREGELWRPKLRTVCVADFAPKPVR